MLNVVKHLFTDMQPYAQFVNRSFAIAQDDRVLLKLIPLPKFFSLLPVYPFLLSAKQDIPASYLLKFAQ
jgi:hypothetical protein